MNRIAAKFQRLKAEGRKGFIPFVTAGDPDLSTSLSIVLTMADKEADIVELGVPFSDPMADGPVIQRSSQRAVNNGISLKDVLLLASQVRKNSDVPLVLFSYFNPILSFGVEQFCGAAEDTGIDGVLVTDLIDDEAAHFGQRLEDAGVDLISLVAPTTTDERLQKICGQARGFIYAVSRHGTTGQQEQTSSLAEELVVRTRAFTDLPIAVGFGISTKEQVVDVWRFADAAVVGSAIVAEIEKANGPSEAISRVESLIDGLLPAVAKRGVEN